MPPANAARWCPRRAPLLLRPLPRSAAQRGRGRGQRARALQPREGAHCPRTSRRPVGAARRALRSFAHEAAAQEVGEEVMVAVPVPLVVERDDEEVLPLQSLQHLLAIIAAGDRIAEGSGQVFGDGGFKQKLSHLPELAFENLLGQIVEYVAVATGEGSDEAGDVLAMAHRERSQ